MKQNPAKIQTAPPLPAGVSDDVVLLKRSDVLRIVRVSESKLAALIREGRFPDPVVLSAQCHRWRLSAVRDYLERLEDGRIARPAIVAEYGPRLTAARAAAAEERRKRAAAPGVPAVA